VGSELRRLGWLPSLLIVCAGVIAAFASLQAVGSDSGAAPQQVSATVAPAPAPAPAPSAPPAERSHPQVVEPPAGGSASADNQVQVDPQPQTTAAAARPRRSATSLRKAVGRKIMTAYAGAFPSQALLARARRGEIGGVILFGPNITTGLGQAISALQQAAHAGGNPPLLIATDQEGGQVKRLSSAPPTMAPAQMTSATAGREGADAGRALARAGITVDLAPVADVNHGSFLGSRSFGADPSRAAAAACQFAAGLQSAGVHATLKHFPGLGRTAQNTDLHAVSVSASADLLSADLAPYRRCAPQTSLVMLSNATYPALDPSGPAVFSSAIIKDLLRGQLGFHGVTVSDTLAAPGVASPSTAVRASQAGVDLLLYTDEAVSARAYQKLLAAVRRGQLSKSAVLASARRIRALAR
jgi:beta-N-acetylhexosaminidase